MDEFDDNKIDVQRKRGSRLDTNRDSELVQRFVRMNLDQNEEISAKDEDDYKDKEQKEETEPTPEEHKPEEKKPEEEARTDEEMTEPRSRRMSTVSVSSQGRPPKLLAKMINQELKKKRKKRRLRSRKNEEIYTDKDRAAAMTLGSKDIKTSLKAKRRQDRSKALCIPEEAEPGNFIALGSRERKCGKLKLAVGFYSKALELNPQEKSALVARSQCYILQGRPDLALKDAEAALEVDKSYTKGLYQKAEALYYLGEFEHSLVYYHRGLRARPDLQGFQLGVHKAQRAIENAIGSSVLSRQPTPDASTDRRSAPSRSTTSRRSKSTSNSSNRLLQLPKQLCVEKRYLDNLLKHPDINSRLVQGNDIQPKIQEAVEYLNTREEFWRQQLPPKFR